MSRDYWSRHQPIPQRYLHRVPSTHNNRKWKTIKGTVRAINSCGFYVRFQSNDKIVLLELIFLFCVDIFLIDLLQELVY